MSNHLSRLGLGLVATALPMLAQTVTTGAVSGQVLGPNGAPVVGAQVRMSSSQVQRTAVTDSAGKFALGLLNAGAWSIQVSSPGFSSFSQTVTVSINQTTPLTIKLAKEGSATVEVVASAANIDPTSTTTGVTFALGQIQSVPKGRDISDTAFLAPGVTTSGFGGGIGLDISINGASGAENSYSIDGLKTNDMRYGGRGVSLVNDFIEQVDIQTGGFKPEYSALGGVFNVLTKSGSNDFAASTWATVTPAAWRPRRKSNQFTAEDKPTGTYDIGAWVGGAIVKDRFFYSVGADYTPTDSSTDTNLSGHAIAGKTDTASQYFAKFNLFFTTDHQLTLSVFGNSSHEVQGSSSPTAVNFDGRGNANVGRGVDAGSLSTSLVYDAILSQTLTLSAKVGRFEINTDVKPQDMGRPLILDRLWYSPSGPGNDPGQSGLIFARGGYGLKISEGNVTNQASIDMGWVLGSHALKAGISRMASEYNLKEAYSGGRRFTIDTRQSQQRLRERIISNDSLVKAEFWAVYLQDTWEIGNGMNTFFGFRAERQIQKDAEGRTFLAFGARKYIQPRIGFTWDVLGDGRSKMQGSYGRYYEMIPQRLAIREFSKEVFYENRYGGNYAGSTYAYNPNAANGVGTYGGTPVVIDYGASFQYPPVAEGIKLPQRDEFQIGYEQTVMSWTAGIQLRYRKMKNPIEDSVITDAAGNSYNADGKAIIWNPRPYGVAFTQTFNSPDAGTRYDIGNTLYPEAFNKYQAVDVTLRRSTKNWSLNASYTWSRLDGNYEGLISSSNGQPDANITASWDYYPYVGTGLLPLDRTHQFKAFGAWNMELGKNVLSAGFSFLFQSGTPISWLDDGSTSTPALPDVGSYGNATPKDGKLGDQGRTPNMTRLDLNLEYDMAVGNIHITPTFTVNNVFNSRPVSSVVETYTDGGGVVLPAGQYKSASTWHPGRSLRFGLRVRF